MVGQADLQSQFPNTALTDIGLAINNLSKKVRAPLYVLVRASRHSGRKEGTTSQSQTS